MSKKKGGKKDGDPVQEFAEQDYMLLCQKKTMEKQVHNEQYKADQAMANVRKNKQRMIDIDKEFEQEREKLDKVYDELQTQYDDMKSELDKEITKLKDNVEDKQKQIEEKEQTIETLNTEFREKLAIKEQETIELKQKIEDMSNEFARMLRDTLDKMQQRIEFAQWDNEGDNQTISRIKNIAGITKDN